MSHIDLAQIEERKSADDVPALVAEVRRLQVAVIDLDAALTEERRVNRKPPVE